MNASMERRGLAVKSPSLGAAAGVVTLLASAAFAVSPPEPAEDLRRGPALPLGGGHAHAWVSVDQNGQPQALGVSISDAAIEGIEALYETSLTLPLPAEAETTGFDHVYLNWNPEGHPPARVWDTPHFDVHFYMMTPAEREAISPDHLDFAEKAARHPEADFVPTDYILEPEVIPAMGAHWADRNTPELNGGAFTHTLIYGSWDGEVRFIEPMVDIAVFETRETYTAPVRQPEKISAPGLYPSSYRIDFDTASGEHRVILEDLLARD